MMVLPLRNKYLAVETIKKQMFVSIGKDRLDVIRELCKKI